MSKQEFLKTFTLRIVTITGLGIGLQQFFQGSIAQLPENLQVPTSFILGLITASAIVGFILWLFYNHLWKQEWIYPIVKWFGLQKYPIIEGRWRGTYKTSWDNYELEDRIDMEITQNYDDIVIRTSFPNSKGSEYSTSTQTFAHFSISVIDKESWSVFYGYYNEPKRDSMPKGELNTRIAHHGLSMIKNLRKDIFKPEKLNGIYLTDKDSPTRGEYELIKIK